MMSEKTAAEIRPPRNEQKLDLPVLPTVDEAVAWANDLIAKIDASV